MEFPCFRVSCMNRLNFNTSRYLGTILSSLLIGIVMGDTFSVTGFQMLGIILTVLALSLIIMSIRSKEDGVNPEQVN